MEQNKYQLKTAAVLDLAQKLFIRRQSSDLFESETPEESAEISLDLADTFMQVAEREGYLFPEPLDFDDSEFEN